MNNSPVASPNSRAQSTFQGPWIFRPRTNKPMRRFLQQLKTMRVASQSAWAFVLEGAVILQRAQQKKVPPATPDCPSFFVCSLAAANAVISQHQPKTIHAIGADCFC
jgi:hypothetical protein